MKLVSLPSTSPLFRELLLVVVLKLALLGLIREVFFASRPAPPVDGTAVSQALLARVPASDRSDRDAPAKEPAHDLH